jgi:CBS domain-containing protein
MAIRARDIMTKNVLTVRPQTDLLELEQHLRTKKVSGAPVVDNGKLVGIISRSDIARHLNVEDTYAEVAEDLFGSPNATADEYDEAVGEQLGERLKALCVRDAMVTSIDVASPDADVTELARTMLSRRHRRLVVSEDGKTIAGIVTMSDLVRLIADGKLTEA